MSISPEEAVRIAREQLEAQAAGVAGQDVAGIYGDPAGAGQHAEPQAPAEVASDLAAKGAVPAAPDVSELLAAVQAQAAQLAALQEQIDARQAAEQIAEPRPPSLLEVIGSSALGSQAAHAFRIVEERLAALEARQG